MSGGPFSPADKINQALQILQQQNLHRSLKENTEVDKDILEVLLNTGKTAEQQLEALSATGQTTEQIEEHLEKLVRLQEAELRIQDAGQKKTVTCPCCFYKYAAKHEYIEEEVHCPNCSFIFNWDFQYGRAGVSDSAELKAAQEKQKILDEERKQQAIEQKKESDAARARLKMVQDEKEGFVQRNRARLKEHQAKTKERRAKLRAEKARQDKQGGVIDLSGMEFVDPELQKRTQEHLLSRFQTTQSRDDLTAYVQAMTNTGTLQCPECSAEVKRKNLVSHYFRVHG